LRGQPGARHVYDERGFLDITARARLIPAPGRACCRSAFFGWATWISLRRGCWYLGDFIVIPFRRTASAGGRAEREQQHCQAATDRGRCGSVRARTHSRPATAAV